MKGIIVCFSLALVLGCGEPPQQAAKQSETVQSSSAPTQVVAASSQEKRFVFPTKSSPFPESSVALDTLTGRLCKTYAWEDDVHLPKGLPLCSELTANVGGNGGESARIPTFKEWMASRKTESDPTTGATKAYRGFTYIFNGTKWLKGAKALKYNESTEGMEPLSEDQYDPLNLFSKEEKGKRILTEAQIRKVAGQFDVSYEEAREEAKQQGYQVPPKP